MVELDEHLGTEHKYCISCEIQFETANKLAQHDIEEHNMCVTCRQFFDSPSSLSSVAIGYREGFAERSIISIIPFFNSQADVPKMASRIDPLCPN
ncbi:uncharacterized protein N7506_001844 [Penicillium brevicompactum]|uniref:uncharacterized protein n=1 Tax=Penicillium brevicompactum TaxID=5074 RepID=UPI0025423543|nr:uncharacterized protein N7506_001844 [Penicillium brevicompactum]KAJ5348591.1 hypothetical protein N7506_001844 [Penicillium brevicompactum]